MAAKSKPVDTVTVADLGIDAAIVGWAGAGQEIVDVAAAPEREAGEVIEDDGEALPEDRRVPRRPQGHLSPSRERNADMALSKVWVHAELTPEGTVAPITLEILAKARETRRHRRGRSPAATAPTRRRDRRRPRRHQGARHRRPRAASSRASTWRAALAAAIEGGDAPDAVLLGTTYDGRDIAARLSVKLDKPVLTNNTDVERRRRRHRRLDPDLRWHADRQDQVRRRRPGHRPLPPEVVRGRGDRWRRRRGGRAGRARHRCRRRRQGARPPRRGDLGSEARRGGHRRLRRPWPRRGRQVRDDRGAGQAAQGRPRRLPGHRRRRLGALLATRSARPARS